MRKQTILSLLLIIIMVFTLACDINRNQNNEDIGQTQDSKYSINVLVVYQDDSYLPLYQQLKQSLVAGLQVKSVNIKDVGNEKLGDYDIVYLSSMEVDKIPKKVFIEFVEDGGNLIINTSHIKAFSETFTGLGAESPMDVNQRELDYPKLGADFEGIQRIAQAFEKDYKKYINKELEVVTAKAKGAEVIVGYRDQALLSVNGYRAGRVIVLSDYLPNYTQYITGFDLQSRNEVHNYFQFFYATANYQILDEIVAYGAKVRYGFAFKKILGTYGRPAMAWQNHYEALESIANRELISWIDLLKKHDQIPSISLVRGSYDWGEWYNTITYHANVGDDKEPKFMGEEEDSYYSNGFFIKDTNNQTITLGKYPEFTSYYSKIEKNFRPYPYFVDWRGNGKIDIIVGTHDGRIGLLENIGTQDEPLYEDLNYLKHMDGQEIILGENAAPTLLDYNDNGLYDMIVGNKEGEIYLLINSGAGFLKPKPLTTTKGEKINVSGEAAPFVGDLNGDGIPDLVIGDETGKVYLFEGIKGPELTFKEAEAVMVDGKELQVEAFATPHIGDYNGDGRMDLLVGDSAGDIHIYLGRWTDFTSGGKVATVRKNIYGKNTLYTGKNVVPFLLDYNGNGKLDLITGQLSFALVYDISDDDFPYKKELQENLAYAVKHHVPIFPHVYFHSHKDDALEKRELELHQENFMKLGIPWAYTGTNQHTWRVNIDDPTQSFKNLMEYNIWNNFGFKTPNAPTDPNFGRDYIWSTPFMMMEGEEILPMVLFTPSPFMRNYGEVYNHLADMDTPLTFFEHIEYKITRGGSGLEHLLAMIDFMEEIRLKHNYAFMTEEQMAKAFINTFYTDYEITMEDNHIKITPDTQRVPKHLAEEYTGTGGLKIELGEKFLNHRITTDALVQYRQADQLYVGVDGSTNIYLHRGVLDKEIDEKPLRILMANGPISYQWQENQLTIQLKSKGMQQIKLSSKEILDIQGEDIKVDKQREIYTITHYGEALELKITPRN